MSNHRPHSAAWARDLLTPNTIILDTETTGLHTGEIVQIAVIDINANVLLDTLVKPRNPIPADATRIHGITDDMVASAPTWRDVSILLISAIAQIEQPNLVVYNAVYDRKMMHQSGEALGLPKVEWKELASWHCAMEAYAQYHGDWSQYHQSYRWQTLSNACAQLSIPEPDAPAHSALGDCLRTLAVMKKMAQYANSEGIA